MIDIYIYSDKKFCIIKTVGIKYILNGISIIFVMWNIYTLILFNDY